MKYRVYGLTLESPIPLPGPRAVSTKRPDVRLIAGDAARFAHLGTPTGSKRDAWFQSQTLDDGWTHLRWTDLFEFLIAPNGRTIYFLRLRRATNESFSTYLLGQVLSFSLLAFGYEPLHATAVIVNGRAVAFLGDCGYGKSTVGAALVARGYALLTDDVLALEWRAGKWIAHAGPPRLKLFPKVARRILNRSPDVRMNPGTSKLIVPTTPSQQSVPLRALYVLPDPQKPTTVAKGAVKIAPIKGQRAFIELTRAAFNLVHVDRARLENHFSMATRLLQTVPMRRLGYARTVSSLDAVCRAVINDQPGSVKTARRTRGGRLSSR